MAYKIGLDDFKMKKQVKIGGCAGLIIAGVLFWIFVSAIPDSKKEATTASPESSVSIGEEGYLSSGGSEKILVGVSKEDHDAILKAAEAKDNYGMGILLATGRVFLVPQRTRVLVLDEAMFIRQVRIIGGESAGRSGWVPYEWIKKQ